MNSRKLAARREKARPERPQRGYASPSTGGRLGARVRRRSSRVRAATEFAPENSRLRARAKHDRYTAPCFSSFKCHTIPRRVDTSLSEVLMLATATAVRHP